jgi:uncharacterized membrane protein YvlD (DUF360 family)
VTDAPSWRPAPLRYRPLPVVVAWVSTAAALLFAAWVVPGVSVDGFGGAAVTALVIGVLNAVLFPLAAALRIPFMAVLGFLIALFLDAAMLMIASRIDATAISVSNFGWALLAALVASAIKVAIDVLVGATDDDTYMLRMMQRIARRTGGVTRTDEPGLIFLEIDGLALPVLRHAMTTGSAPTLARWVEHGSHRLVEWEPDLSSQTGASQAGILLGSNDDIPAFRWVDKETGRVIACSGPQDCAEIEAARATGVGLLVNGGSSRGNLLSGEAEEVILTCSRMSAETHANPGYRAFFANGLNVTRTFVLFFWEVFLEWSAALRAARRDVRPRGHRGGIYPFMRAAMCVVVRDLIVYGVIADMMRGRPVVYSTFSSYDEVAHHSGLERADTLEALRKLDGQFARIDRARKHAARPYLIVVLSDHGQTQGATFKQRNGYGLDELVERSLESGRVTAIAGGDEQSAMTNLALEEAVGTSAKPKRSSKHEVGDRQVVVLGSGNLGLVYLMDETRRLTLEEIDERHPRLIPTLAGHPHVGWLLIRSGERGALVLGGRGARYLETGEVVGEDPLAVFSPTAGRHLARTDGFAHVADIMVGSFYDPQLEEGCAFEELISFHGGLGGPQTRPFVLYPAVLPEPDLPIVGAEAVHGVLTGWRRALQGDDAVPPSVPQRETAGARPEAAPAVSSS